VDDWDSVAATVEQSAVFLHAYQTARGLEWARDELEMCWAAGLWALAYNAKKEASGGGKGYIEHLRRELEERSLRAGIAK
jgi:hypothetical protein